MIIFLCSPLPQCGKDTVADILCEMYNAKRLAFGDAVKQQAKNLGWDGRKDEKGREFIIKVGELAKEYDKYHWVNIVYSLIVNNLEQNIVVTDLRYAPEMEMVERLRRYTQCLIIGVERDSIDDTAFVKENQSYYKSIPKDIVVQNNSTIEHLTFQLLSSLKALYPN